MLINGGGSSPSQKKVTQTCMKSMIKDNVFVVGLFCVNIK